MSKIRCKNTKPEKILIKFLLKKNYIYQPNIYGKPDFANFKNKTVIFVDGCFWHKCKRHYNEPSTNINFWKNKIYNNTKRDKEVNLNYKYSGWKVIRIWEHDLTNFINTKYFKKL